MLNYDELINFIKENWNLNELHQEYQDNDTHFVVDSYKKDNTLTIKVKLLENKDKKNFEKWLENVDESLFGEVLDELSKEDGLTDLDTIYNSKDYMKVIDKVKSKTKEIAAKKIQELQKIIN